MPVTRVNRCEKKQQIYPMVYTCTRVAGHDGHHMCHNNWGGVACEWWDDEEGNRHIETDQFKGRTIK